MKLIPIAPGEKRPRSLEWQRGVFADTAEIARHWEQHPDDGVGLVAGERSGWFVLDVDVKAGGVESLDALADARAPSSQASSGQITTVKANVAAPIVAVTTKVPPLSKDVRKRRPVPSAGSPPPDQWTSPSGCSGSGDTPKSNGSPGSSAPRPALPLHRGPILLGGVRW